MALEFGLGKYRWAIIHILYFMLQTSCKVYAYLAIVINTVV